MWSSVFGHGAARMSACSVLTILEGQKEMYRDKSGMVLQNKSKARVESTWAAGLGEDSGTSLLLRPSSAGARTTS